MISTETKGAEPMKSTCSTGVLLAAVALQIALLVAGIALGGTATREGGMLILLSLWCWGMGLGWAMRGGE